MTVDLGVSCHATRDPLGRVLFYLSITFFGLVLWVQRWDNERAPRNVLRTRSGMGWMAGARGGPAWRRAVRALR